MIKEITVENLDTEHFVNERVEEIRGVVGDGMAINALSGGVDSSAVTMLGHRALGNRLKTVFVENGLMRDGESEQVAGFFKKLGVEIEIVDARKEFFSALKGVTDPEQKREAITQTFYRNVFGRLVRESGAKHLLHASLSRSFSFAKTASERQARPSGFPRSYSSASPFPGLRFPRGL
jgi:GMP synthase (glutamine-hydrolysing)